ncbi:MAG: hypothetical protein KC503_34800 [Myxococcales bacterium]|nr:hypothetical protein [Myxococcales bacterium]
MTGSSALEILVDTDVRVGARDTPKKVVDAIRRQLRDHDQPRLLAHDGSQRELFELLQSDNDQHRMPQGLLARVTETCLRHGVAFSVVDKRSMVSCPALRRRVALSENQSTAVQRLLLRDGGVIVAAHEADRHAVAAEMIARRQQRALVLTAGTPRGDAVEVWRGALAEAFAASAPAVTTLAHASGETRVTVASYAEALAEPKSLSRRGLVIFDDIERVDPIALMRAVRATDARYMLGLARNAVRGDGLSQPLYLALGGIVHEMPAPSGRAAIQLACRPQATRFEFDYSGRADYQAMLAALAADEPRNAMIATDVAREARPGNVCLVLSERRDHLAALGEAVAAAAPELRLAELSSDLKPRERNEVAARVGRGEIDVVFATGQLALDRLKTARISRLFVAFPFSHARRLERLVDLLLTPAPEKSSAVVYDYDDASIAPLARTFSARARILDRLRREAEKRYLEWAQLSLI